MRLLPDECPLQVLKRKESAQTTFWEVHFFNSSLVFVMHQFPFPVPVSVTVTTRRRKYFGLRISLPRTFNQWSTNTELWTFDSSVRAIFHLVLSHRKPRWNFLNQYLMVVIEGNVQYPKTLTCQWTISLPKSRARITHWYWFSSILKYSAYVRRYYPKF